MPNWFWFLVYFISVPVSGALVTHMMVRKGVSIGVRRFVTSTIGALAVLVFWLFFTRN